MRKKRYHIILYLLIISQIEILGHAKIMGVNKSPTTVSLLHKMQEYQKQGKILVGRHNDIYGGIEEDGNSWFHIYKDNEISSNKEIKSDIKRIVNQYPSILNVDLGINGVNSNVSTEELNNRINGIKLYYEKVKGLISISFHLENPWWFIEKKTGNGYRYKSLMHKNVVSEILNGKTILNGSTTVKDWYDKKIEKLINLFLQLKDRNGNLIPIIFRPFHEASADWFWWGHNYCSNKEYIELFIYTVNKIKEKYNNILIVYSPDRNWYSLSITDRYMDRYPGDNYVDIIGYDNYHINTKTEIEKAITQLRLLSEYGKAHNKLVALTETGNYGLTIKNWFTNNLYQVISAKGVSIAYVCFWSSWSIKGNGYCLPYKKLSKEAKDFKRFVNKRKIILSQKMNNYSYNEKRNS